MVTLIILNSYERVSGQRINFQKSEICFCKNVRIEDKRLFQSVFTVRVVDCHERYLGLPSSSGRRKTELFNVIEERV